MLLILLIILWLVSPIVLLILLAVQIGKNSDLKRQNKELSDKLGAMAAPEGEAPEDNPAPAEPSAVLDVSDPQKADGYPDEFPTPSVIYDLPAYNVPVPPVHNAAEEIHIPAKNDAYPEKVSTPKKPAQEDNAIGKSVSTINIILILGALLISLSGFIFAVAAWGALNTFFKSVVLLSFSALFFAVHSFTERKLKLPQTGRIFYMLGSIFLPAAVAAAGILKVFGEYLSFSGEGRAVVLAIMFMTVCVPFFKGAHDYKSRFLAAVSSYSFSAAVVSLIWQLSPNGSVTALFMAIFALLIAAFEPLIKKLFCRLFGEDNVFSLEWNRFSAVNAWVLSIASLFVSDGGFVALAAFAMFSACFLTKVVTDKSSTAGALSFAFFITAALLSGFDPGEISDFTCIIAATSLIYAVLSAMGIFPETLKKIMRVLMLIAASAAGLLGIIELISENGSSSWQLVIAAAAIYAQLLILTLRNKTAEYKAMSFGAMLWLSAEIFPLLSDNGLFGSSGVLHLPGFAFFASYLFMLAYFAAVRFTRLGKRLYSAANDVIIAVYAAVCMAICMSGIHAPENSLLGLIVIAAGAVISALSRRGKISAAISPALTFLSVFPLSQVFEYYDITLISGSSAPDAVSAAVILICIIAAVLLFVRKDGLFSKSFGTAVIISVPILTLTSLIYETSDFVPMLAVTAYTGLYLFKISFPKERFSHINLLWSSVTVTSFFAGGYFTDSVYLLCFPAAAMLLIFAVITIGAAMGGFEKTERPSESFLLYAMPILSGIMLFLANEELCAAVMIFGAVLALCALFLCMFRKNTMGMIFPLISACYVFADTESALPAAIFAAVLAAVGHIMFREKIFEGIYSDVFSISAFVPAVIFARNADSDILRWTALLLLALLTANLMRTGNSRKTNRILLTAAAAFIFPVLQTLPFFDIPSLIELQFNLLPVPIFCVILRIIWRDALNAVDNFSFVSAAISLVILFIGALGSGEVFDAVFIGIILLVMLSVSFVIKKKRWFVLAVTAMVASAVLLSFGQRDSIAWLVYLALAGAALISLGVVNELKKQHRKSGEDSKLTRFMSDWTW